MENSHNFKQKNFTLGVINGILNLIQETLFDPTLVLVSFLNHLTSSPILLGLVVPLRDSTWSLPQLWSVNQVSRQKSKISIYRKMAIFRSLGWLGVALSINLIPKSSLLVVSFFLFYLCGNLASGLSGLAFLEVVGKTIHPRRRAEFYAWRLGIGGVICLGATLLVRWLINSNGPLAFPYNYGILSILYFVFGTISIITYSQVNETPDAEVPPVLPIKEQLRFAFQYLHKTAEYRGFLLLQSALLIGGSATSFFAIYVENKLGGSVNMIGIYLGVNMVSSVLSNLFFGRISKRFGNALILRLGTLAGLCMSLLMLGLAYFGYSIGLLGMAASIFLIPVYFISSIRTTALGVSSYSFMLDIAPPQDRTVFLGFTNSLLGIVQLATALSGGIVALFGYKALFFLIVVMHVFALIAGFQLKHIGLTEA